MIFTLKEFDRQPVLSAILQFADGSALNLTGATVYFVMRDRHGNVRAVGNATVTVPTAGKVEYQWQEGDTDVEGLYDAEFVVVYSNGLRQTVPSDSYLGIRVLPQLARFLTLPPAASLSVACLAPSVSITP